MRVRRSPFTLVALLAATVVLTGCGSDEPEPEFDATPSTSPSQVTTPSPSAEPSESATSGEQAEEALIRLWVQELNASQQDGDVEAYLALSHCDACVAFANKVQGAYDNGGHITTEGWTVRSIRLMGRGANSATYKLKIFSSPSEFQESAEAAIQHLEGGPRTLQVLLRREGGAWRLDDFLDMGK